jgi:hypothetical protein
MKLRLLPIVITILSTSAILFGGWFIYHSMAVENPLNNTVRAVHGVTQVTTDITNNNIAMDLKLTNDANLRDIYAVISKEGAPLMSNRQLQLKLDSQTSPQLEEWWSSALFEVAQAMETKHYADIPQVLKTKAQQIPGLQVATEMDDTNVYVRLTDGNHSKYIILPRIPAKIGVWPQ